MDFSLNIYINKTLLDSYSLTTIEYFQKPGYQNYRKCQAMDHIEGILDSPWTLKKTVIMSVSGYLVSP